MPNAKRKIRPLSDTEEAEIQSQIAADSDDFEATDEQLAEAKSFDTVFPDLAAEIKRGRGRPRVEAPKELVSLRLDPEVIEKFRRTGKGWQQRINDALKRVKV